MADTKKLTELTVREFEATIGAARAAGAQEGVGDIRTVAAEGVDNLRAWLEDPPGPLSGQWAGSLTPQSLADEFGVVDDTDDYELAQAYEDGYFSAVYAWVDDNYPSIDVG